MLSILTNTVLENNSIDLSTLSYTSKEANFVDSLYANTISIHSLKDVPITRIVLVIVYSCLG